MSITLNLSEQQIGSVCMAVQEAAGQDADQAMGLAGYALTVLLHGYYEGDRQRAVMEMHNLFDQLWVSIEKNGSPLSMHHREASDA